MTRHTARFPALFSVLLILAVLRLTTQAAQAEDSGEPKLDLRYRWIFYLGNLLPDKNIDDLIAVLERGSKCGYNGLLVCDTKFMQWDSLAGTHYNDNVKKLRDACTRLHLQFIPTVVPISNDLLERNPNLAEGLPVVDCPFVVKDGALVPSPELAVPFKNAGFEEWNQNGPLGWNFVDAPGKLCTKDTEVKCEGTASLKMDDIKKNSDNGMGRISHALKVHPWVNYHIHARVKTQDFERCAQLECKILTADGWSLNEYCSPVKATQDWTDFDAVFNPLDHTDVNFYVGVWGAGHGTLWIDDIQVEPAGFVNVLRRKGTPVKITSQDKATVYEEGKDFAKIEDPKMGNQPWPGAYSVWHDFDPVKIPAGSALKEGQTVLCSYYHPVLIGSWGAVMACLAAPETMDVIKWQADQVKSRCSPDGYFFGYDEMRCQGWDKDCVDTGKTAGGILADNIRNCTALYHKVDPGKPLFIWNDMFDPFHNAQKKGKYYIVKGDGPWANSWEGLDPSVIVANWMGDPAHRQESMKFFADRGNRQILAGYYDADPKNIDPWLREASKVKGIVGVIYTTWASDYSQLENFATEFKKFEGPPDPANDDKPAAPSKPATPGEPQGAAPTAPATPAAPAAAAPTAAAAAAAVRSPDLDVRNAKSAEDASDEERSRRAGMGVGMLFGAALAIGGIYWFRRKYGSTNSRKVMRRGADGKAGPRGTRPGSRR